MPIITKKASTSKTTNPSGTASILIVDDEKNILRSASRILKTAGYTVFTASDGISALDIIRRSTLYQTDNKNKQIHDNHIDLVITDVVMPEMSGERLLNRIRSISTELPVIVSSGYGHSTRVLDFLQNGAQNIIPKPFEKETLLQIVQQTLDALTDKNTL